MTRERLTRVVIVLAVIALLFYIPVTRMLILWVLPLGSGIDDFIMLAAVLAAGTFLLIRYLKGKVK